MPTYFELLKDWRLLFIAFLAGVVTLLTSTTVATRPAAIRTQRVAMAFSIFSIFFMITRFANFFYSPILGIYVDRAAKTGNLTVLLMQIRIVLIGAAVGAVLSWLLLPTLIEIYCRGIRSLERQQSIIKVFIRLLWPGRWIHILTAFRRPSNLGVSLFNLEGVPPGFLILNALGTGVWTVGVLSAMYVSALHPESARTAVLLSGLVNSVAAIFFSMVVDPKASLITDQVIDGARPQKHVYITAVFLTLGNIAGAFLAQLFLIPGAKAIEWATLALSSKDIGGSIIIVAIMATVVTMKASTTVAARIAAVITRRVATAIAIYNFFFLITRLAQQIYAPIIGSLVDVALKTNQVGTLEGKIRWVIFGCSFGALLGWIFMPTFVEIYRKAINGMERYGSLPRLLAVTCFKPSSWGAVVSCFRKPTLFGVRFSDLRLIPRNFLLGNVIVISIHTVGVMAATYASALYPEFARTATLLSSVVNSVATIVLSIIVDPITALITDEAVAGTRPLQHVKIMAVYLAAGTLLGTLLSQVIFVPAAEFIKYCSILMVKIF
jgi:hypothetical protein